MGFRTTCINRAMRLPAGLAGMAIWILAQATPTTATADDQPFEEALELLADMEKAWSEISDYTKLVDKTERLVDGDFTEQTVYVKFRRPGSFYIEVLAGQNKKGELIYPARPGSDMAVAHAGGFKGGLARFLQKTRVLSGIVPTEFSLDDPKLGKWQHQTATDTSIGATVSRIAANVRRAIAYGEGEVGISEDCDESGLCLLKLSFSFPSEVGDYHEVADGESLWSIADAYGRPMYVVWYNNPEVRGPRKIEAGQTLFVPRYYSARGTVWVSPDTLLPTRIEIFDANDALYERYVYRDVQLNIGLTDLDFDPENPDYRF